MGASRTRYVPPRPARYRIRKTSPVMYRARSCRRSPLAAGVVGPRLVTGPGAAPRSTPPVTPPAATTITAIAAAATTVPFGACRRGGWHLGQAEAGRASRPRGEARHWPPSRFRSSQRAPGIDLGGARLRADRRAQPLQAPRRLALQTSGTLTDLDDNCDHEPPICSPGMRLDRWPTMRRTDTLRST